MMPLVRQTRRWARLVEVVGVVVKHLGYHHMVDTLGLRHLVPRRLRRPAAPTDFAAKLRVTIEELGPTFIKLAQVLSTRPDLVPPRYLEELAKLQDAAPPVPFVRIRPVLEEALGRPLEEVFRVFATEPIAAASLGQAHAAVLHDGTPVVVKVQRPDIRRLVERDIEVIAYLARTAVQRSERARVLNLLELVEEFQLTTRDELDYTREGRNMDRLRENLKGCRSIHVPRVFWDYTTPTVLTQERIHGTKITDTRRLSELGINTRAVAEALGDAFMQQVLIDGFFHADPHPGNLVVTDDGTIVLLDFGMVARLDESVREAVLRLLVTLVEQDSRLFAEQILELGRELQPVDRKRVTADADRMLRHYYGLPARDVNIGELLNDTLRLCTRHLLQMPSNFGLMVKVFVNLDGIAKALDPDYSYLDTAQRFVRRAVAERLRWDTVSLDAFRAVGDARRLLVELPTRTSRILTKLADGELKSQLEVRGLDELTRHLDRIGNRIAYSLVVSALLIGSALYTVAQVPPFIRGYPILGVAAFVGAVAMGIWLLVAILRSGSLR